MLLNLSNEILFLVLCKVEENCLRQVSKKWAYLLTSTMNINLDYVIRCKQLNEFLKFLDKYKTVKSISNTKIIDNITFAKLVNATHILYDFTKHQFSENKTYLNIHKLSVNFVVDCKYFPNLVELSCLSVLNNDLCNNLRTLECRCGVVYGTNKLVRIGVRSNLYRIFDGDMIKLSGNFPKLKYLNVNEVLFDNCTCSKLTEFQISQDQLSTIDLSGFKVTKIDKILLHQVILNPNTILPLCNILRLHKCSVTPSEHQRIFANQIVLDNCDSFALLKSEKPDIMYIQTTFSYVDMSYYNDIKQLVLGGKSSYFFNIAKNCNFQQRKSIYY